VLTGGSTAARVCMYVMNLCLCRCRGMDLTHVQFSSTS
jgi:hypothetical protein